MIYRGPSSTSEPVDQMQKLSSTAAAIFIGKNGEIISIKKIEEKNEDIQLWDGKAATSATQGVSSGALSDEFERLGVDTTVVKENAYLVGRLNNGDALRRARAAVSENTAKRLREERLNEVPLFSWDMQPDVPDKDMKGAVLTAALISLMAGPNALVTAVVIPISLFLANTRGTTGDATRAIGGFSWDLALSVIQFSKDVTVFTGRIGKEP
jgi:hypothetical protein